MNINDVIAMVTEETRSVWIGGELLLRNGVLFEYRMHRALPFKTYHYGLTAYAEIPVPASQLVMGESKEDVVDALRELGRRMEDQIWLQELHDSI